MEWLYHNNEMNEWKKNECSRMHHCDVCNVRCLCASKNGTPLIGYNFAEGNNTFEHITFVFKQYPCTLVSFDSKLMVSYNVLNRWGVWHALAIMANTEKFHSFSKPLKWLASEWRTMIPYNFSVFLQRFSC